MNRVVNLYAERNDNLKCLYDIHLLAQGLTGAQWDQVMQLAGRTGLGGTLLSALDMSSACFATEVEPAHRHALARLAAGEPWTCTVWATGRTCNAPTWPHCHGASGHGGCFTACFRPRTTCGRTTDPTGAPCPMSCSGLPRYSDGWDSMPQTGPETPRRSVPACAGASVAAGWLRPEPINPWRSGAAQLAAVAGLVAATIAVMALSSSQIEALLRVLPPLGRAVSWMEGLHLPFDLPHVAYFSALAFALRLLLPRLRWWWILLGLGVLAGGTELMQFDVAGRTPSLGDVRDDLVGRAVGVLVAGVLSWVVRGAVGTVLLNRCEEGREAAVPRPIAGARHANYAPKTLHEGLTSDALQCIGLRSGLARPSCSVGGGQQRQQRGFHLR